MEALLIIGALGLIYMVALDVLDRLQRFARAFDHWRKQ